MSPQTTLLEPPVECPPDDLPWVRSFIAAHKFTAPKTGHGPGLGGRPVEESPHEYLPRTRVIDQVTFDRFADLIDEAGYKGRFLSAVYTYLDVPDEAGESWRYWVSASFYPPAPRAVINRASNTLAPMLLPGALPAQNYQPAQGHLWPEEPTP